MRDGRTTRSERGAALVAVLFAMLVCELAVFLVVAEIHHVQSRFVLDRDRTAASRLAEAGYAHALAVLAQEPEDPAVRLEGRLAEGRYEVEVRPTGPNMAFIVCRGWALSSRRVSLAVAGWHDDGDFYAFARHWRHDGPDREPER